MPTSPTQRSLKLLRDEGWIADVTEKWIAQARKRKDLFGCIDILCLRDGDILGIQATSSSNVSARVKKLTDLEVMPEIRKANIAVQVWGWKRNAAKRWVVRRIDIS